MHDPLPGDGVIRKLWMGESVIFRDHLLRLDPDSRRNRFGGAVSDAFITSYADAATGPNSVIHGFFVEGTLRGTAELHPRGGALPRQAEAAFSIEKPWQSSGVGTMLLARTLLTARNRGYKLVHMVCRADNRRMQKLARRFDAELSFDFGSVVGEVESPHPTPLSLMREFIVDSAGFATAILDVQSRLLRPT